MDPKPILAVLITVLILGIGIYLFSDKSSVDFFNSDKIKKQVSEARRNIPLEASLSSSNAFTLNFDTTLKTQDIEFTFSTSQPIKINGQIIRQKSNQLTLHVVGFSGKVAVGNGSSSLIGKGNDVRLGDLEFTGESTIDVSGDLIDISLNNVQGDFKFNKVTGNFNVITNQSPQKFLLVQDNVEFTNFLGGLNVERTGFTETIAVNGSVSKVITKDYTITKDY